MTSRRYNTTRIHFGDHEGQNLCYYKRSFMVPLEVTQDSTQVTCEYCKRGSMGSAWRMKYGIEKAKYPKRKSKVVNN